MKKFLIPFLSIFLFSGCVSIFCSSKQNVTVNTATPGADIYYNGNKVGTGTAIIKAPKKNAVTEISVKKPGYFTKQHAIALNSKSPVRFSNIPWIPTFYGIFVYTAQAYSVKAGRYSKMVTIPEMVAAPIARKENEKFLYLNKTSLKLSENDTLLLMYANEKKYKANKTYSTTKFDKKVDNENTIFTNELEKTLKKYNFIDTTKTIFPNYTNTLYLNASVTRLKIHKIDAVNSRAASINQVEVEMDWDILDYFETKLKTFKIKTKSDLYRSETFSAYTNQNSADSSDAILKRLINNALEYSLIDLMNQPDFKALIQENNVKEDVSKTIVLDKPQVASTSFNKLIKSGITIKTKEGHGSGFIISEDGYIVTNYHVVANQTENLEVILLDGTKYKAQFIRRALKSDLALIKVDANNLIPFKMSQSTEEVDIGSDVAAIGTPRTIELGQSVSKGSISGIRKANGISYIQADMNINAGNSGGAVLNSNGEVIGVVTSKLMGFSVEGIAFLTPINLVFSNLNIKYK